MYRILIALSVFLIGLFFNLSAQTKIEKAMFNGNYKEALLLLEAKKKHTELSASDYLKTAQCYSAIFDFVNAINFFQKTLAADSTNNTAYEGLADASINLGLKKNALIAYNYILATDSLNVRIFGKKAALLYDLGRYNEAEILYNKLLSEHGHNRFFYRKYLLALHKQQKFVEILKIYEAAPDKALPDIDVCMLVADTYQRIGDNIKALNQIYAILQTDSLFAPALNRAGLIHFSGYRNYNDAAKYYHRLYKINPNMEATSLRNLAICEYFNGKQEFAAHILDSLLIELISDPMVPFYAGLSYRKLGNVDRALEFLELAAGMLSMPPYTSDFYHHLGRAYQSKRMYPEALEAYQTVLEYDAENVQVLYDIAITHEEYTRNHSLALTYYQQFIEASKGKSTPDVTYAENRVKRIKEELFFE